MGNKCFIHHIPFSSHLLWAYIGTCIMFNILKWRFFCGRLGGFDYYYKIIERVLDS